jgi:hypothetical protein
MATTKSPGYLSSALRVFDLSISEMLWSRRTIFMALVVGAPVAISLVLRLLDALGAPVFKMNGSTMAGPAIFGLMIWVFYLRFTIPVLGVFYGTSLIADEVEDKTITYLFTRPIRKGSVLLGKYIAYLASTSSSSCRRWSSSTSRSSRCAAASARRSSISSRTCSCWRSAWRPTAPSSRSSARGSSGHCSWA